MHPVVAHLQGAEPGRLPLTDFDVHEVITGIAGDIPEFVEFGIVAVRDNATIPDHHRGVFHQSTMQQRHQFGEVAQQLCDFRYPLTGPVSGGQVAAQLRHFRQAVAEPGEIPGSGRAQGHPGEDALHVPDCFQVLAHGLEAVAIQQVTDGVLPGAEFGNSIHRSVQPAFQVSGAHGGAGARQHREQGIFLAALKVAVNLQVPAGGRVQQYAVRLGFGAHAANVGQLPALGFLEVVQQTAGGGNGQLHLLAAETAQVLGLELIVQRPSCCARIKVPGGLAANAAAIHQFFMHAVFRHQNLGGGQPLQLGIDRLAIGHLGYQETPTGDVNPGQPGPPVLAEHGKEQRVAAGIQQRFIAQGPGGDNANHTALHRSFAGGGVADLFGNGDRVSGSHQACQVIFRGVIGHPRHGNRFPSRFTPCGQGDVQHLGRHLSVVIKQLVEIPHAVKQ